MFTLILLLLLAACIALASWWILHGSDILTTSEKSRGIGRSKSPTEMNLSPTLHAILDLARWSPSGDNEQPWHFEVITDLHIRVHYKAIARVYDADSHTQQLGLGAMLETMKIAASKFGLATECIRDQSQDGDYKKSGGICCLLFDVKFKPDSTLKASPLASSIESRVTERKLMSTRQLTQEEKTQLRECLNGPTSQPNSTFSIDFRETFSERWTIASLMSRTFAIRLSMPEAFPVMANSLEFHSPTSIDRMPIATLGLDPFLKSIFHWCIRGGFKRLDVIHRLVGPIIHARIELLPCMMSAAHCIISVAKRPTTVDDFIECGRCLARFWLTLTHLGLRMQPEIVPLVFARYVRTGVKPSTDPATQDALVELEKNVKRYVETKPDGTPTSGHPVIMARCGQSKHEITTRSMRRPLEDLMYTQ